MKIEHYSVHDQKELFQQMSSLIVQGTFKKLKVNAVKYACPFLLIKKVNLGQRGHRLIAWQEHCGAKVNSQIQAIFF